MSGPTLVVFVGLLIGLLVGAVAALVWQEGRKRSFDILPAYVVTDLIDFVLDRLAPAILESLGADGVERIIDWEVRYLLRDGGTNVVAGGTDASVAYIIERVAETHGVVYSTEHVRAVLALEAEYLAAVGAVGDQVTDRPE